MEPGNVTYVFDGDTFVGQFALSGGHDASTLTVWYKDVHASVPLNGLEAETVAKVLLGELVRDDLASQSRVTERVDGIAA